MKYLLLLFSIAVYCLLIFGFILNYEIIEYSSDLEDIRFLWLDINNTVTIPNSDFGETKEGITMAYIAILSISLLLRILGLLMSDSRISFLVSTSVSFLIELTIGFLVLNFITSTGWLCLIAILYLLATFVLGIGQIQLMGEQGSGMLNVYDSVEEYLNDIRIYKNRINNLKQQYKQAL